MTTRTDTPTVSRPAETAGGTGAIALLASYVLGVHDPALIACLGAVVGLIPGLVTLLVSNGGIRGVARRLWEGRS